MEFFLIFLIMVMIVRLYFPYEFDLFLLDLYYRLEDYLHKLEEKIKEEEKENV